MRGVPFGKTPFPSRILSSSSSQILLTESVNPNWIVVKEHLIDQERIQSGDWDGIGLPKFR